VGAEKNQLVLDLIVVPECNEILVAGQVKTS